MRCETVELPGRYETHLFVFEHDPGDPGDPLTITDGSVLPEKQGQRVRLTVGYSGLSLTRDQVADLTAGLLEWLAVAGTPAAMIVKPAPEEAQSTP